jgi:hypothetical protein
VVRHCALDVDVFTPCDRCLAASVQATVGNAQVSATLG